MLLVFFNVEKQHIFISIWIHFCKHRDPHNCFKWRCILRLSSIFQILVTNNFQLVYIFGNIKYTVAFDFYIFLQTAYSPVFRISVEFAKCYTFAFSSNRLWPPVWPRKNLDSPVLLLCCSIGRHLVKNIMVQIQRIYSGTCKLDLF